ncbi:uncharacterized protein MONBRDRAFT_22416, partial [Monosiga brevicollis MX1]
MAPTTICITGASRGLGRAIALEAASAQNAQQKAAHYVLVARNADELHQVEKEIQARHADAVVTVLRADLGDLSKLPQLMQDVVSAAKHANCRTVSYAPGPLDTGMQATLRTELADEGSRQYLADLHAK